MTMAWLILPSTVLSRRSITLYRTQGTAALFNMFNKLWMYFIIELTDLMAFHQSQSNLKENTIIVNWKDVLF